MSHRWLYLPIYLDGKKRFDAAEIGSLSAADAYKRMDFVFNEIEFCLCEGRLIDLAMFNRLEDLSEVVRQNKAPLSFEILDLADQMSSRYGLEPNSTDSSWFARFWRPPSSPWIREAEPGEFQVWIDQKKIVAESNERLFGKKRHW